MPIPTAEELRESIEKAIHAELADGRTRLTNDADETSFRVAEDGTIEVVLFLPDWPDVQPADEDQLERTHRFRIRLEIVE